VAVTIAAGYQLATRPATYREAVAEGLAQHEIVYTRLEIYEICLPDPSCILGDSSRTYQAVTVYRDTVSPGRVTCYDQRGDCYLDLVTLGIVRVPLHDLRGVRMLPKPLMRVAEHILAHVRALAPRATVSPFPGGALIARRGWRTSRRPVFAPRGAAIVESTQRLQAS